MQKKSGKIVYIVMGALFYIVLLLICLNIGYVEGTTMKTADKGTLYYIETGMENFESNPFSFKSIEPESGKYIGIMSLVYFFSVLIIWSNAELNRHDRAGKEHGSSKWFTDYKKFERKFTDPIGKRGTNGRKNIILAHKLFLSFDGWKTKLNINEVVVGGSGAGKSRYKTMPNALQGNCSYVFTDPSGELLETIGKSLEMLGYRIYVLNLIDMDLSQNYNPFDYINREDQFAKENDVTKMIDTIMANTVDPNGKGGEQFWEDAMRALYASIIHLLIDFASPKEQNFATVVRYLREGKVDENGSVSLLEQKINNAKLKEEEEIKAGIRKVRSKAFTNWETFKLAGYKTAQSILVSAAVRIGRFDNEAVARVTSTNFDNPHNNIKLSEMGDRPTALFCVIPTADLSFNFIVASLYSQMFETLYYKAGNIYPNRFNILDKDGFAIETLFKNKSEAKERLDLLKQAEIRKIKKRDRNTTSDVFVEVTQKLKENENIAGRYSFQVYLPPQKKTTEEVRQMSFQQRKQYLKEQASGGEVIREFYSMEKANEFKNQILSAKIKRGRKELAWKLRFLLDEFGNITTISLFCQRLATMRKYGISCMIVLQNLEQLVVRYEKEYRTIKGNCDIVTFLGSSETETTKEVSELLGDATNRTKGTNVNGEKTGKSYNQTARKLMDPAELAKMDNEYCITVLRGMDPFYRKKYDFEKHPNHWLTGDANELFKYDEEYQKISLGYNGQTSSSIYKLEVNRIKKELTEQEKEKLITDADKHKSMESFLFEEGYSSIEEMISNIEMQTPVESDEVEYINQVNVRSRSGMVDAANLDAILDSHMQIDASDNQDEYREEVVS